MEQEDKTCPMLSGGNGMAGFKMCLGEECAWWDERYKACAVLRIAIALPYISKK